MDCWISWRAWRPGGRRKMPDRAGLGLNPSGSRSPNASPSTWTNPGSEDRTAVARSASAVDAGIPSMFHNDATWREMVKWVELGVPPMEVIQSATLWPARFLGRSGEFGTVEAGAYADLVMVRGDPLTDMTVVRDPVLIVKGGEVVGGTGREDR